jgi:hypothetical protein
MNNDIEWFLFRGKDSKGPFSSQQLKRLYDEGKLSPSMTVWRKGMAQKLSITAIREFDFQDQMQASQPVVVEAIENKTFPIATTRKPKGVFIRPEKLNQKSVFTHPAFIAFACTGFVALLFTSGVLGTSGSGNQTVAAIAPLPMKNFPNIVDETLEEKAVIQQVKVEPPKAKVEPPKVASLDDERTIWFAGIDELTNEMKGAFSVYSLDESSNNGFMSFIDFGGQDVDMFLNHIGFNIWMPDDFGNGQKKEVAFRTPKMKSPIRVSAQIDNEYLRFSITRNSAIEVLKAGRIVMSVVDDNKRYTFEYRDQDVQKAIKYISR